MSRKTDLTAQAAEGYEAQADGSASEKKCPHLFSSACWYAWQTGAWLKRTGRSAPRNVSMGRGYQVHANDMLIGFDKNNAPFRVH